MTFESYLSHWVHKFSHGFELYEAFVSMSCAKSMSLIISYKNNRSTYTSSIDLVVINFDDSTTSLPRPYRCIIILIQNFHPLR